MKQRAWPQFFGHPVDVCNIDVVAANLAVLGCRRRSGNVTTRTTVAGQPNDMLITGLCTSL